MVLSPPLVREALDAPGASAAPSKRPELKTPAVSRHLRPPGTTRGSAIRS